jgi:fermentation-respiration switch protein FrsA (DUF1100 family)
LSHAVSYQQEATGFLVDGLRVRGVFHRPAQATAKVPVIVMCNGFATEWSFGTAAFIEAFTRAGMATLNFDYRSFGGSEGEPRQLLDIPGQLNDCRAAIAHALAQPWVDASQLVIWGSSLGGGHAISMAAECPQARALVAQVPHCCSRAAFKTVSWASVGKGMMAAISDALGSHWGRPPKRLPVVAEPPAYAVMSYPGWTAHYLQLAADSLTWQNAIVARSLLRGGNYRPIAVADKVQCPALLVAGLNDAGVPIEAVRETASKIRQCELFTYPGDHFEVYHGDQQPEIVQKELDFIIDALSA